MLTLLAGAAAVATVPSVVPEPFRVELHDGSYLTLDTSFTFRTTTAAASPILHAALPRFRSLLFKDDNSSTEFRRTTSVGATLSFCAVNALSDSAALSSTTNESYVLEIAASGSCTITAPTIYGAMHGMETFVQLSSAFGNGLQRSIPLASVTDQPRFPLRATMIDTARRFLPLENILHHLDAMSCVKMNLLHWHLVDSQSWPYASLLYPELSRHGAYSPSEVYTQKDIAEVVLYARQRGIMVIPEIDTPGHVWAGLAALEPAVLTTCFDGPPGGGSKIAVGTGTLDPSKNATFDFLAALLGEVIPLFGSGMFMIGGDEVPTDCWASNPGVLAWAKARGFGSDMAKVNRYYTEQLLAIVAAQKTHTHIMCWEDVFNSGLLPASSANDGTLINVWSGGWEWCDKETSGSSIIRDNTTCSATYGDGGGGFGKMHIRDGSWRKTMAKAAAAGFKTILSSPFYINAQNMGSNFDEAWPYLYAIDPANFTTPPGLGGVEKKEASVQGVEACLWSSWVNKDNFANRFWPAAASVAERGWSRKDVTSIDDFRRRLHTVTCELQRRGLRAEPAIFGGSFFHANGTLCSQRPRGHVNVMGPPAPGCLPRFSTCGGFR